MSTLPSNPPSEVFDLNAGFENQNTVKDGVIPSISGGNEGVFDTPVHQGKKKTQLNTLLAVGLIVLCLIALIGALFYWIKSPSSAPAPVPAAIKAAPIASSAPGVDAIARKQNEIKAAAATEAKAIDSQSKDAARLDALKAATSPPPLGAAGATPAFNASTQRPVAGMSGAAGAYPTNPAQRPYNAAPAPYAAQQFPSPAAPQFTPPAYQAAAPSAAPMPPAPPTPADRQRTGSVLLPSMTGAIAAAGGAANAASRMRFNEADFEPTRPNNSNIVGATANSSGARNNLSARLEPTTFTARQATRQTDIALMLRQGQALPCALKTAIDTTLAGLVVCQVIKDVYSANGKTLLIERGSSVFGEQTVGLLQGQARIFALWRRIDTPQGVSIDIDSPTSDELGRSGMPAGVDSHFWARFSGAILYSLIKDTSASLTARAANSGSSGSTAPTYNNSTSGGTDVMTEIIKSTVNIPPTGVVNPGTVINIMVARDVSFSNVYALAK